MKSIIHVQDWTIILYVENKDYNVEDIMECIWKLGCSSEQAKQAYLDITKTIYNIGFTFTNYSRKTSLLFIGFQTSKAQFINTLIHECRHLQQHIANYKGLDQNSEDVCYLIGYLGQVVYQKCYQHHLI